MSKIDWDKPIETVGGIALKVAGGPDQDGDFRVVRVDGLDFEDGSNCSYFRCDGQPSDIEGPLCPAIRNTSEPESLHIEPKPDNFTTESPIRAFSEFDVNGRYALGKGFRPAVIHMTRYLDAMESKEGWRLVQILEAESGNRTFLFRKKKG